MLASASPWRFGYSMFGFSVDLLPGAGGVSFAFVMVVTLCSGTSLAPRLAGFTVPARPTRDKSQWENVSLWGRSGLPGPLGATHRWRCVPFILPQVVA